MKDKEFVRKALETHIEALERSIGLRASAVLSKGQTLLVLHQLKAVSYTHLTLPTKA